MVLALPNTWEHSMLPPGRKFTLKRSCTLSKHLPGKGKRFSGHRKMFPALVCARQPQPTMSPTVCHFCPFINNLMFKKKKKGLQSQKKKKRIHSKLNKLFFPLRVKHLCILKCQFCHASLIKATGFREKEVSLAS